MVLVEEIDLAKVLLKRKVSLKFFVKVCILSIFICSIYHLYLLYGPTLKTTPSLSAWTFREFILSSWIKPSSKEFPHRDNHLILVWTPFFGRENWLPSTKDLICSVNNCKVTSNRHQFNESSSVILHWRDINPNDLPNCPNISKNSSMRCPLLVLFNKEAPPHTYISTIEKLNDKIHWTITYRRDSDVIAPYGKIIVRKDFTEKPAINLNRKGVCWLVSNCHTPSLREEYVEELKQFIAIKVFGKCSQSNSTCPHRKAIDCYKWLSKQCRFYLSFENSMCRDYSTEKLYYAMMFGMVPIVSGGEEYDIYLPNHSFINIKDYSSPSALAQYLNEVDKDDSKYLAYFEWRKTYMSEVYSYEWLCDLCEKLHKTKLDEVKPYPNIVSWWYQGACEDMVL